MDSILTSIKNMLGISENDTHFDDPLVIYINSALSTLHQIGVGPIDGFSIKDDAGLWTEFIQNDKRLEPVKTYIYMKVKLIFDPPINSAVIEAMKQEIDRLEWRILVVSETKEAIEEGLLNE